MLNRRTLQRINKRPKQLNRLPLLSIGAGSLALAGILYALLGSLLFALAALLVGALGVLGAYRTQKAQSIIPLTYDLRSEIRARFSRVQQACEALSSSERIWYLRGGAGQWTSRNGDAAQPPPREPAQVGLLETPGIRANVSIWGIDAIETKVLFFPEAVLIYRDERYEGASYESLKVSLSSARFYEKEAVPEDAEVIGRSTGSGRSRMPVVHYGLLEISLPRGLKVSLQVSSRDAAARFARAFSVQEAGKETTGVEEHAGDSTTFDFLTEDERAKVALAYKTLGVRVDASMSEVSAVYRQMARKYHPDKVTNLTEEDRESAERQMKEINAAYTELQRLRRNLIGGTG
jgi:hypothetical protein